MLVYFSGPARNLDIDLPVYKTINNKIHALGHTVTHDWIESARMRVERGGMGIEDLESIVRDAEAGIESADVLIAEVSGRSTFGVGYEVAMAMFKRKPILLLIKKGIVHISYASGLHKDFLTIRKYDEHDLEKHVEDFIKMNVVKNKDLRFNFVIDRRIYNHLRMRSFETGKTKAEILRDLLMDDMQG